MGEGAISLLVLLPKKKCWLFFDLSMDNFYVSGAGCEYRVRGTLGLSTKLARLRKKTTVVGSSRHVYQSPSLYLPASSWALIC